MAVGPPYGDFSPDKPGIFDAIDRPAPSRTRGGSWGRTGRPRRRPPGLAAGENAGDGGGHAGPAGRAGTRERGGGAPTPARLAWQGRPRAVEHGPEHAELQVLTRDACLTVGGGGAATPRHGRGCAGADGRDSRDGHGVRGSSEAEGEWPTAIGRGLREAGGRRGKVPRPTPLGDGLGREGEPWLGRELGMAVGWPWPQSRNVSPAP